jgi:transaldolase
LNEKNISILLFSFVKRQLVSITLTTNNIKTTRTPLIKMFIAHQQKLITTSSFSFATTPKGATRSPHLRPLGNVTTTPFTTTNAQRRLIPRKKIYIPSQHSSSHHLSTMSTRRRLSAVAENESPPFTVLQSELSDLQKVSSVLYDTKSALNEFGMLGPQAATVSPSILLHAIQKAENFDKGALEGALVYAKEKEEGETMSKEAKLELIIDKATVNLAAKFAARVDGRVSVEVDAKKSSAEAIVSKTERLMKMFREVNVETNKLLFKIPATWEGVQAMRQLENKGVPCHATLCYCLEQTALAAKANASLIQIYYARINSYGGNALALAQDTKSFIQSVASPSKILAASIRSAADARAMAGCDYILCNERVLKELNANAAGGVTDNVRNAAGSRNVDKSLADSFTKATFEAALKSSPANEAIQLQLQSYLAAQKQLESYIEEFVGLNC